MIYGLKIESSNLRAVEWMLRHGWHFEYHPAPGCGWWVQDDDSCQELYGKTAAAALCAAGAWPKTERKKKGT